MFRHGAGLSQAGDAGEQSPAVECAEVTEDELGCVDDEVVLLMHPFRHTQETRGFLAQQMRPTHRKRFRAHQSRQPDGAPEFRLTPLSEAAV